MCADFLLMSKWLCGEMTLSEEDEDLAARVTRLVIGGESVTSKVVRIDLKICFYNCNERKMQIYSTDCFIWFILFLVTSLTFPISVDNQSVVIFEKKKQ